MHAGQRAVWATWKKKRNIAPVFSTRYTTLKQYFYFHSVILPPLPFTFSFQCVGYLSGSYLRGGSGLTRDDGRHIIRPSKNISTDEKSIRFLGCPITETAEIITNGTVDILNNFTLDIEQSYPPVLFCRTMFPAIFHAGNWGPVHSVVNGRSMNIPLASTVSYRVAKETSTQRSKWEEQ